MVCSFEQYVNFNIAKYKVIYLRSQDAVMGSCGSEEDGGDVTDYKN